MTGDWPRCGESRHISAGKRRGRETNGAAMAKPSRESAAKTSTGKSNRQCFLSFPPSVRTITSISAGVLLSHGAPLSLVSLEVSSLCAPLAAKTRSASQITPGSVRGARQNQAQIPGDRDSHNKKLFAQGEPGAEELQPRAPVGLRHTCGSIRSARRRRATTRTPSAACSRGVRRRAQPSRTVCQHRF